MSDDIHYVANNPWVHELSLENAGILLDPAGPATIAVVNYAPLQMLVHSLAWQLFGPETLGHHLLNVFLHSLASLLLVALFLRTGVPPAASGVGGLLFLLHPANVEAVAWISQLKTTLSLVLCLAALLAYPRRTAWASVFFVLALLAKPTAVVALPVAALLEWSRDGRPRWGWLSFWAACFLLYGVAEFSTHQRSGAAESDLLATPGVLLRTMAALGMRYLVMASSSLGISAFHEPAPARSLLDPWWLCALPVGALLGWRLLVVLRRRSPEAAYWVWAGVSFAPVSQVFPFLYPLADRYLYFILPGLLGASLLALQEASTHIPVAWAPRRRALERVALGLGLLLGLVFSLRAVERAALWRSGALLTVDAATHYPEGKAAYVLRAQRAVQLGDVDQAVSALRQAAERGYNRFEQLETDPAWAPVRDTPEFRALVHELAAGWIERLERKPNPTQGELRGVAHAHIARGEIRAALAQLERALAAGGPFSDDIRLEIQALRSAVESGREDSIRLGSRVNVR